MGNVDGAMKEKEILKRLMPNLAQRLAGMKEGKEAAGDAVGK